MNRLSSSRVIHLPIGRPSSNNALHRDAVWPVEFDDLGSFMAWFQVSMVSPARVSFCRWTARPRFQIFRVSAMIQSTQTRRHRGQQFPADRDIYTRIFRRACIRDGTARRVYILASVESARQRRRHQTFPWRFLFLWEARRFCSRLQRAYLCGLRIFHSIDFSFFVVVISPSNNRLQAKRGGRSFCFSGVISPACLKRGVSLRFEVLCS